MRQPSGITLHETPLLKGDSETSDANLMQEITPEDPQIIKTILAKVVSCYIKKTV
jgi:hypothetical protein